MEEYLKPRKDDIVAQAVASAKERDEDLEITPEYIVEQSKILSDEELLCLIENFSEQQYTKGANSAFYDYR